MNYVSDQALLTLSRKNGTIAYKFKQHRLVVGDPATGVGIGNTIDFSTQSNDLLTIERFDAWSGGGASDAEACGQNHIFYEAPYINDPNSLQDGYKYIVMIGHVTINGTLKRPNTTFEYATGDVVEFEAGTIVHYWPFEMKTCGKCAAAAFRSAFMEDGTESPDYWSYEMPVKPMNSMNTSYDNWFGKTIVRN